MAKKSSFQEEDQAHRVRVGVGAEQPGGHGGGVGGRLRRDDAGVANEQQVDEHGKVNKCLKRLLRV